MPSGKVHDRLTVITAALSLPVWFVEVPAHSPALALTGAGAYFFSGYWLSDDLDIHSVCYKRWGIFRFLWWPYRTMVPHRSWLSHGLVIGPLFRVAYFCLMLFLTAKALLFFGSRYFMIVDKTGILHHTRLSLIEWILHNPVPLTCAAIGLILGGFTHAAADSWVSFWKRIFEWYAFGLKNRILTWYNRYMVNIIELFQSFQTQDQAIEHLEKIRWHGLPTCVYCSSQHVSRHASGDRAMMRWQCHDCHRTFSVTVGTIFHGTHIPLKNWFLVIALMLNAKKSASAYQIARDLGMRRPTVWSMMHRVRVAMASDQNQGDLLFGIVEADETYVGGKPRKGNNREDDDTHRNKRGMGTDKTPVIGTVERGGRVVAEVATPSDISAKGLTKFIKKHVDLSGTWLVTDQLAAYRKVGSMTTHATVNHAFEYVNGLMHTNTIEGFWSLVKRSWYGSHHHYSKKYMHLYIAKACYKYNNRKAVNGFDATLGLAVAA